MSSVIVVTSLQQQHHQQQQLKTVPFSSVSNGNKSAMEEDLGSVPSRQAVTSALPTFQQTQRYPQDKVDDSKINHENDATFLNHQPFLLSDKLNDTRPAPVWPHPPAAAAAASCTASSERIKGAIATAIEEEEDCDLPSSSPLPATLYRLLFQVSKAGESSTLSWDSVRKEPSNTTRKRIGLDTAQPPPIAPVPLRSRSGQPTAHNTAKTAGENTVQPPRKKHRNGLSNRNTRMNHRKRPLHLIQENGGTTTTGPTVAAASARFPTNGSEPEDASHYDSEGTSTTSNSELSNNHWKKQGHRLQQHQNLCGTLDPSSEATQNNAMFRSEANDSLPSYMGSLREAFRVAVDLVLEHWFQNKGGYKISLAESKIHKQLSPRDIFVLRKERLLEQLELSEKDPEVDSGPPFTIQRLAEVLVEPEKYYTQTHKLCNCLEKLLLVSSPITAFGGSRGGVNAQTRREEMELAALADERYRLELEFRQMRKRRSSLVASGLGDQGLGTVDMGNPTGSYRGPVSDAPMTLEMMGHGKADDAANGVDGMDAEVTKATSANATDDERREQLEAAARASLRNKFDHVGIDPHHLHHGAVINANVKAIADSRSLTNSPPPPSLTTAPNLSGGLLRSPHAHGEHSTSPVRSRSPILFNDLASSTSSPSANMHLLQIHHAAAVAGVSPFDLMTFGHGSSAGSSLLGNPTALGGGIQREMDLECRSSASSDVDSESDDVSFDDSASDRSDGSDSANAEGSNFSAVARAMALQRAARQQRTQKLTTNNNNAMTENSSSNGPVEETLPEDSDDVSDSSDVAD